MKASDKLINTVLDGFQTNKGRASLYCFDMSAVNYIIYNVIEKFHNKNPNSEILIVVDCYNTRQRIVKFLNIKEINFVKGYSYKILSTDYIKPQYNYNQKLVICVGVNDNYNSIENIVKLNNFFMYIMTKPVISHNIIAKIRQCLADIDTKDFVQAVKADYLYSPVEEHRFGINLSEYDQIGYDKFTEYINTSVAIFGDLTTIEKCRMGDISKNISAGEFRYNFAIENGWNENLDTSVTFQKQIDDIYNPNALSERAHNFFNISRQRRELVYNNFAKLDKIADIVTENINKNILIVSTKGEYAATVTEYINKRCGKVCRDYHDCLDAIPAIDICGEPIIIKSGEHKGEVKMLGAIAQCTANEKAFNNGLVNVLSIKSSSNVKLKIAIDLVIFTSSACSDIVALKQRFNNLIINCMPHQTYVVYCNNTIEQTKLDEPTQYNIKKNIIEEDKNIIEFDENSGNIIL